MNKYLKFLRSLLTSLLFICLVFLILLSIFLTILKSDKKDFVERIDRNYIVENILKDEGYNGEFKEIYLKYVDGYINYVFYKRSFPSVEVDESFIQEKDVKKINNDINIIKEKLDIDYNIIVNIRKVYNFVNNNSVYMLVFFGIILIFFVICTLDLQFKNGIKFLSIAIFISTIIGWLAVLFFNVLGNRMHLLNIIKHLFLLNGRIGTIYKILGVYLSVGIILYISFVFCKRFDTN